MQGKSWHGWQALVHISLVSDPKVSKRIKYVLGKYPYLKKINDFDILNALRTQNHEKHPPFYVFFGRACLQHRAWLAPPGIHNL